MVLRLHHQEHEIRETWNIATHFSATVTENYCDFFERKKSPIWNFATNYVLHKNVLMNVKYVRLCTAPTISTSDIGPMLLTMMSTSMTAGGPTNEQHEHF